MSQAASKCTSPHPVLIEKLTTLVCDELGVDRTDTKLRGVAERLVGAHLRAAAAILLTIPPAAEVLA